MTIRQLHDALDREKTALKSSVERIENLQAQILSCCRDQKRSRKAKEGEQWQGETTRLAA